ncbi:MAG: hypothetical protein WBW81_06245 [Methylocella sp.]
MRLDRLRAEQEFRDLLAPFDDVGLLSGEFVARPAAPEPANDDALLTELGVGAGDVEGLSTLKHVKPRAEVHASAEEIANRTVCKDFEQFKPLFAQVQKHLEKGLRKTRSFQTMAEIKKSEFFIVGGQKAYISRRSAKNFARNTTGATPACTLSLTMERKATSLCAPYSARCTETELAGASRSPTQGRFLKACRTHKARKAARFTCSAACPIIPISSRTETSFTRSASPEGT